LHFLANAVRVTDDVLGELALEAGLASPSIVLHELCNGGTFATYEAERGLYPASMIKVPIAFALDEARANGEVSLDDRVIVAAANMTSNDAPSAFVSGYAAALGELGHAMLAASDNVATNVLIDVLGRDTVGAACARLGLRDTHVRRKLSGSLPLIDDPQAWGRNAHPADDAARLFTRLARESGRDWIRAALAAQVWNDKLSRGFAADDVFAHKTGDTDEVSHDGGILTLPDGRRFAIVVYTALAATPENDAKHAAFARSLRPYLDE
jgi:beta-lactamase class A